MNNKRSLSMGTAIMFGAAVFSMHFGGSCMLWPVTWGQQSGSSVTTAMLGIFITAVLLPFAAYLAMARGEGTFYTMAARISRKFAVVFGGLTVAVLGPLFVIPRMSAAAWDAFCQVFGFSTESMLPIIIFQAAYYLIAYWFLSQPGKILDKLGKYLTPVLILTVIAVVVKSLTSPLSPWVPKFYDQGAFIYGFINGYQTMDLPAALVFGAIIITNLKEKGIDGQPLMKNLLVVGGTGFALLCLSHMSQMLVGASTGYIFKDVSYAKLYATVILKLWGVFGGTLFNFALLLAALTSAVGLGSGTAEYFVEAGQGKLTYKHCAVATMVVSAAVACFGLGTIIVITGPILSLIYPPCIALVLGYIFFGHKKMPVVSGAAFAAFGWGLIDCLIGYLGLAGIKTTGFMTLYNIVPGAASGIGWIIPSVIGGLAGYVIFNNKIKKASAKAGIPS